MRILNHTQITSYRQNGFLVIPDFVSNAICNLVISRAYELIEAYEMEKAAIFSTKDQSLVDPDYFMASSEKIHFFYEENAFDSEGQLQQENKYSINKIGHALHELDPIFKLFSQTYKIGQLAQDLTIDDPRIVQSMYICKQPYIGGEVTCHQDSTFLYVDEQPITGLWFALEDATINNGCLWAIPGGHQYTLKSRMFRNETNQTQIKTYDHTPWPLDKMVPLEVKKGSVIILHGLVPHMSYENKSKNSRHAYTLHMMSGHSNWSPQNWLQRETPFPSLVGL